MGTESSICLVIILIIFLVFSSFNKGLNSSSEFADPCSFRFEGKVSPDQEWVALFLVNNAAQLKGRDLVFNFDNRVAFKYYRMVIFKTMSNHPRAKPLLAGLRLMEYVVPDS